MFLGILWWILACLEEGSRWVVHARTYTAAWPFSEKCGKNNFFQQVLGSGWRFFNEKNVGKSQSQVGSADAAQHGEDDPRNAISAVLDCPISTRKK